MYNGRIPPKLLQSTRFTNQMQSTQPINALGQTLFFESRSANTSENFLTTTSGANLSWDALISRNVIFNSPNIMKCCLDSSNVSSFIEKFCTNDLGQATKFEQLIAYLTKEFANNESEQTIIRKRIENNNYNQTITPELIKNVLYQIFPNIEEITANDVKIVLRMSVSENFFNRYLGHISYSSISERIMSRLSIRFSTECLTSSNFDNIHEFCEKIIGHVPVGILELKSLCDNLVNYILALGISTHFSAKSRLSAIIKLCQDIYYYTELSKANPNHPCLPEFLTKIEEKHEVLKSRTRDDVSKLLLVFQSPELVKYLQDKLSKYSAHVEIFERITTFSKPFPAANLDINSSNLEQLTNLQGAKTELFNSRITDVTIQNCSFSQMSFTNVKFDRCNFIGVDLSKCKFNNCIFNNCTFPESNLTYCMFESVKFLVSDFNRADCSHSNFFQIEFYQTYLTNCKLESVKNIIHRSADNLLDTFTDEYLQQVILQFAVSVGTVDDKLLKNKILGDCIRDLKSEISKCFNNKIPYNESACNDVIGAIKSLIKRDEPVSPQPNNTNIQNKLIELVETNPNVFIKLLPDLYDIDSRSGSSNINKISMNIKNILVTNGLPDISEDLLGYFRNNQDMFFKFMMNLNSNYTRFYISIVHHLNLPHAYRSLEISDSNRDLSNLDLSSLFLGLDVDKCNGHISFRGSKFNQKTTNIVFYVGWDKLNDLANCEEFVLKCISTISTIDECLELKFKLIEQIKAGVGRTQLSPEDKNHLLQLCDGVADTFLITCKPESINDMVEIQVQTNKERNHHIPESIRTTKSKELPTSDRLKKIIDTLIKFDTELLNKFMLVMNSKSLPQDLSFSAMSYQKRQSMMANGIDFNMQEVNSRLKEFQDLHLNIIRRMPIADRVSYDELTSFVCDGGKLFQLNAYYNDKKNLNQSDNMGDLNEL